MLEILVRYHGSQWCIQATHIFPFPARRKYRSTSLPQCTPPSSRERKGHCLFILHNIYAKFSARACTTGEDCVPDSLIFRADLCNHGTRLPSEPIQMQPKTIEPHFLTVIRTKPSATARLGSILPKCNNTRLLRDCRALRNQEPFMSPMLEKAARSLHSARSVVLMPSESSRDRYPYFASRGPKN